MSQPDAGKVRATRGIPMWLSALWVTFLMQATASFLSQAVPVLGPSLTEAAGVAPERIGYLTSLLSLGSLWFLMGGGPLLAHFGPVRMLQLGGLLSTAALLILPGGVWMAMALAALLIGVGYGPSPPAGSEILMRHSPPQHRSLIFSIKQAGAPLGGALAGMVLPALAAAFGWRLGLVAAALVALVSVAIVQPLRRPIDAERRSAARPPLHAMVSPVMLLAPLRAVRLAPSLAGLGFLGFAYAAAQGSLFGLFVTFLSERLDADLTAAGSAFAVMQTVGVVGRVATGWLADRLGSALRMLTILGISSSAVLLLFAAVAPGWPWAAVVALGGVAGFAVASWNGVLLAEVARAAPEGRVGDATSGSIFFTFLGYVIGPTVFATIVAKSGSYPAAFLVIALLPLAAVILTGVQRLRRARA
jgi:MFS family permease